MPHISIKMLEGRTEEQKIKAAEAVQRALSDAIGASKNYISVSVEDYTPQEWQVVFDEEITDKADVVYIKPQYDPKSLL